jgi:hypothetical protein
MKTKLKIIPILTVVAGCLLASNARAQIYSIDSFTIAGGSGTSTGGAFAVSGTLGQSDAGTMSGGNYSLAGGFWGAIPTLPPVGNVIIKVWVIGGQVHLRFTGIPGRTYVIERASSVTGPWRPNSQPLAVITMPLDGVVEFVDTAAPSAPQFFYRTSTP